jgi:hypothetical protein
LALHALGDARTDGTGDAGASLRTSFAHAEAFETPYLHWLLHGLLPAPLAEELGRLPLPAMALDGVSGRRELHNDRRLYLAGDLLVDEACCLKTALAFQAAATTAAIALTTGADLEGCFLRIEYARDIDGFWLEPHTDIGVKRFTMVYSLADGPAQAHLGTDVYADEKTWFKRSPFVRNDALVFIPAADTWHGFEPRPIPGVRRSLIVNYVTPEWRDRDQLAFPEAPIRS